MKERTGLLRIIFLERDVWIHIVRIKVRIIGIQQEVLIIHELFIHEFTVEEVTERLSHSRILKLWASEIDGKTLESLRFLVKHPLLDDPALLGLG